LGPETAQNRSSRIAGCPQSLCRWVLGVRTDEAWRHPRWTRDLGATGGGTSAPRPLSRRRVLARHPQKPDQPGQHDDHGGHSGGDEQPTSRHCREANSPRFGPTASCATTCVLRRRSLRTEWTEPTWGEASKSSVAAAPTRMPTTQPGRIGRPAPKPIA
jgi:hypothetical protein